MESTGIITEHVNSEPFKPFRLITIPTIEQVEAWETQFPNLFTKQIRELVSKSNFWGEQNLRAFFIGFFGQPKVKYSFGLKVTDFTQLVGRLSDVITNENAVQLLISYPRFLYDRAADIEQQHCQEEFSDPIICLATQRYVFDAYEQYIRTSILPTLL